MGPETGHNYDNVSANFHVRISAMFHDKFGLLNPLLGGSHQGTQK